MLKPSELKKPKTYAAERFEFKDPGQDKPWVLWLKKPTGPELSFASDLFRQLVAKFIDGDWVDDEGRSHKEPSFIPGPNGAPVIISRSLLDVVSNLDVMQEAQNGEAEYSAEQIIELIPYYETAWIEIQAKYVEVLRGPKVNSETTGELSPGV